MAPHKWRHIYGAIYWRHIYIYIYIYIYIWRHLYGAIYVIPAAGPPGRHHLFESTGFGEHKKYVDFYRVIMKMN